MTKKYSLKNIAEIAGDDQDFILLVVKTFLEEIPPDLSAMIDAVENNNRDLAYQFAHKMKPNFEMFGLNISKSVTAIESWTKSSKNISTIQNHLDKVVAKNEIVIKELKEDFNINKKYTLDLGDDIHHRIYDNFLLNIPNSIDNNIDENELGYLSEEY